MDGRERLQTAGLRDQPALVDGRFSALGPTGAARNPITQSGEN
jgi:hypothetical protein